jgi:transcriptional accessory protein Tex/SPT6
VAKVADVLRSGQEVEVRIVEFDAAKRRIGLTMLPYVEGEVEARKAGGRKGGGGKGGRGGRGGGGFGDEDLPFKMSDDELEALSVGDEFASPFEAAFARAAFVVEKKEKGEKYGRQSV